MNDIQETRVNVLVNDTSLQISKLKNDRSYVLLVDKMLDIQLIRREIY